MGTLSGRGDQATPSISRRELEAVLAEIGGEDAALGVQTHEIVSFIAETEGQAMAGFLTLLRVLVQQNEGKRILWRYRWKVGPRREGGAIVQVCSARLRFE